MNKNINKLRESFDINNIKNNSMNINIYNENLMNSIRDFNDKRAPIVNNDSPLYGRGNEDLLTQSEKFHSNTIMNIKNNRNRNVENKYYEKTLKSVLYICILLGSKNYNSNKITNSN